MVRIKTFRMSGWMMAFLIAGLFLVSHSAGVSQNCQPTMTVSHIASEQLSLGDVDFEHFQGTNLLFTINVANTQLLSFNATLDVSLDINLINPPRSFANAVHFSTTPFVVPPGGRTITNLNIGQGSSDIKAVGFVFDQTAKDALKEAVLGTGTFPAGTYTFHLTLNNADCVQPGTDMKDVVFTLQNPTHVELRSPRDGDKTNAFPLFEFFQDGDRAELVVAEKNPDQSPEDAITRKPPMVDVDLTGQNSFLYAGGRPLEEGKMYVWQVVSKVIGAGGKDVEIASPIWQFTVSNTPQGDAEDVILRQLEEMFGKQYPEIFEQIHKNGFTLTGSYTHNNTALSRSELLDLLNQLREMNESADVTFH